MATKKKAVAKKPAAKKKVAAKRKPNAAFMKPMTISPALAGPVNRLLKAVLAVPSAPVSETLG